MENIIINVDSKFRNMTKYPNSGYIVQNLSENIKNCKYIRVSSIELPKIDDLFYSFNQVKDNQNFVININNVSNNIIIPTGSYNKQTIINIIQQQLNYQNINITITNINNYIKITNNLNTTISINFSNNSKYPSLGKLLGFNLNTYNINGFQSISGESELNLTDDKYILLRLNDYGTLNMEYSSIMQTNNNTVQEIPVQSSRNYMTKVLLSNYFNHCNHISKAHVFKQPVNINKLEIELFDSRGNRIDMTLNEYSLTIEIGIVTNSELSTKMENDTYRSNLMPNYNILPYF